MSLIVQYFQLPKQHHNYNRAKRVPVYRFFARRFGLDLKAVRDEGGQVEESFTVVENREKMLVFTSARPLPPYALRNKALRRVFRRLER